MRVELIRNGVKVFCDSEERVQRFLAAGYEPVDDGKADKKAKK